MDHLNFAKYQVLKEKYKPKLELLPIQKLTKEEKELGALETLDLENMTQLTAIAKCWVNQDRNYSTWVTTCEDYAGVALDDNVNKRFFYKSGIQEALPSVRYFTRKQINMLFEAIYFEIIPDIILQYELSRDYTLMNPSLTTEILDFLEGKKSVSPEKIQNQFSSKSKSVVNGILTKMFKKNLIDCVKSSEDNLFYFVSDFMVKKVENKWYRRN